MKNNVGEIKNKIFGNKSKNKETALTGILQMAREFNCLGEILGREFEVLDKNGKLQYTISQNPMKIKQLNNLIREFIVIKNIDNENESKKWGAKK